MKQLLRGMKDDKIIELLFERKEEALREVEKEYLGFCHTVASNILSMREDREECVNDTYHAAWDSIPPHKPAVLSTYLGKLTRRISLKVPSAQSRAAPTLKPE